MPAAALGAVAIAGVAGSVYSAKKGSQAAQYSADVQSDSAKYAADLEYEMWQQSREDLKPFMEAAKKQIPQIERGQAKYEDLIDDYHERSKDYWRFEGKFRDITGEYGQIQSQFKTLGEEFGPIRKEYADLVSQYGPLREQYGSEVNQLGALVKAGPGEFKESEYYNYLLDQAAKAADRSVSAGRLATGTVPKLLTQHAIPLAGAERQNWLNEWLQTKINPQQAYINALGSQFDPLSLQLGAVGNKGNLLAQQMTGKMDEANLLGQKAGSVGNEMGAYSNNLAALLNELNMTGQMGQIGTTPFLSSIGQAAGSNQQAGNALSNLAIMGGQAQAGGALGSAAAYSDAIKGGTNQLGNLLSLYMLTKK